MIGKVIRHGQDARSAILEGIIEVEKTVCSTLGPKGHTVLIDKGTGHPTVTKDGVSVAKAIQFKDPWKNIGAMLTKNMANKTNHEAGDGTTTSTLLFSELAIAGHELVTRGLDSNEIRLGYEAACKDVLSKLETMKKVISSDEDIKHVATISGNNDESVGETLLEAFSNIGEDGVVTLKNSYSGRTEIKFSSGYRLERGLENGFFANTPEDNCEFKDGYLVVVNQNIRTKEEIQSLIMWCMRSKKPVVLYANSIEDDVISRLSQSAQQKTLNICVLKPTALSRSLRDEQYKDLEAYFNMKAVGEDRDQTLDQFDPEINAGHFDSCLITPQYSIFEGVNSDEKAVDARVMDIKAQLNYDGDADFALTDQQKDILKERIAKLTGGIATIYVGGDTDIEMKERLDRYEDAVNAVRAAVSEGIIAGGGTALLKAAYKCESTNLDGHTPDFCRGYETFLSVCKKPAKVIMMNTMSQEKAELTAAEIAHHGDDNYGYDAKRCVICDDLYKQGIIDPYKVTERALVNSTSTAAMFLTTDACITDDGDGLQSVSISPNDKVTDEFTY